VIFSRKVMDEVMAKGGWLASNPSPIERDKIMEGIKSRTKIVNNRENLITISYFD